MKHYAMKTYGGVNVYHVFLTSALVGGEWSASLPSRFIPAKKTPVPIGYEARWTQELSQSHREDNIKLGFRVIRRP
jgi:hypothetical protein